MAATRRNSSQRRRVKKKPSGGIPGWLWLLAGVLIGGGGAIALMLAGYMPETKPNAPTVDNTPAATPESALVEEQGATDTSPKKPRYDFFKVLPEMEVVVPEQELSRQAEPSAAGSAQDSFILQVGSFKTAADAEQMKAQLALLGSVATVHTVTVDNATWHRVRIGPFKGARKADEMRRMLSDNQFNALIIKVKP